MITYENIITDLKKIANEHKQINSFGTGDITQLIYLTQERDGKDNTEKYLSPYYPLLYVVPGPVNRDTGSLSYGFSIIVMDIMSSKDYNLETTLLSDTLQMIDDVLSQFQYSVDITTGNYQQKYDIALPVTYTPFTESFDDLLVGWTLNINIIVDQPINRCIAPYNDFTN